MRSMRGASDPRISFGVNAEMAFLMWSASEVDREAERVNARHDSGEAKERQPKIAASRAICGERLWYRNMSSRAGVSSRHERRSVVRLIVFVGKRRDLLGRMGRMTNLTHIIYPDGER